MASKDIEAYKIQREYEIKKIITTIFIVVLIITAIVFFSLYIAKADFRKWVDINILRKDIASQDVPTIDLSADKNNQVFCYSNYICILKEKNLLLYDSAGTQDTEISLDINTAIFDSNDKYLAVAEKNGQDFCLILDKNFLWKEKIDGEILRINVNKNGYVALVTTDTTYKSIITLYSPEGNQLLRNYLAATRVIDLSISNDNNYVAFVELDSSGTLINSNVKVISVEKAKINPEEAIIYTFTEPVSRMITKIKYQDKNTLVCMYDDGIDIIKKDEKNNMITIENNITFASVNLNNSVAYIQEETSGLFNYNSILTITNTSNGHKNTYHLDEVAKEMYTHGNVIGINTGTEIYFVSTSGMLIKKYTSNQEITNVVISNNLSLIIYKDRIDIINL